MTCDALLLESSKDIPVIDEVGYSLLFEVKGDVPAGMGERVFLIGFGGAPLCMGGAPLCMGGGRILVLKKVDGISSAIGLGETLMVHWQLEGNLWGGVFFSAGF